MHSKIIFVMWFALIVLAGCAGPSQTTTFTPTWSDVPLTIVAQKSSMSNDISISINDTEVCSGSIDMFSPTSEMHGEYKGHKVITTLEQGSKLSESPIHCTIYIDGELAVKFDL